jgi:ABC-2 type transport system ATP-binding protein
MEDSIQFRGLTKQYGTFTALEHLDLTIPKGEVLGYLGPNGAGKTTTIRLLLGLIHPTNGSVLVDGLDTQTQKAAVHKKLAYVPGEASLWPSLTGEETLHLLANIHGSADTAYRTQLIQQFQFDPTKKVRTYSKGSRQKVTLIAALATRAPVLVLDEPTSGLDPLMEQVFRECIQEAKTRGQTVFLSSHILEEVEALCDRVAVLRAGKLVETGTLAELRHLSAVKVEATFGGRVPDIAHAPGVSNVHIDGRHLTCHVHGPIDALLKIVSTAKPLTFLSREPSLEELFLLLYGDTSGAKADR